MRPSLGLVVGLAGWPFLVAAAGFAMANERVSPAVALACAAVLALIAGWAGVTTFRATDSPLRLIVALFGLFLWGSALWSRLAERVPTLCFSVEGAAPSAVAEALAARDIGVRSGHMYSPRLVARLGRMPGGVVRASLVHYNTVEEIEQFAVVLEEVVRRLNPDGGDRR